MTAYYRNESLFSEIYLEEITRQPEQEHILASLRTVSEYRDYANRANLEAWTQSYIHQVLYVLGFAVREKTLGLTLLYPSGSFDQPVSLCVVTLPSEDLDDTRLGRNWAEKTIRALREQDMQWGLLTNGNTWRIYHRDEATPYETYLEIDLDWIINDQAKDAYQIFYKFMKADNFAAQADGQCQFDVFNQESKDKIDYIEKELAKALKQREEGGKGVLSDLCMGYVETLRAAGDNLDAESLRRKIYHGSMLYMFRLLFLFYAEARGLLSDENQAALAAIKADARDLYHSGQATDDAFSLWERLSAIFVDIDQTYNGGLFSPQESEFTRFIEETRAADRHLAGTLFNLITYHEKNGQERPISYRDMSVRHLGTLYEGLLEHKLFITAEPTEVRVTKGKIEFIPASRGGKLTAGHYLPAGAVYFAGDPSERKSTGSYYTPEYIVDYIVRNTVGEKLKTLKADFSAREKDSLTALARAVDAEERAALGALLEENALTFVREHILTLSVLDPAMGSGHFLVNATNLVSNFITEFLNDLGIAGDADSGTAHWRRWVVENCIYGVDLNPLAVELAKLSLWILSMAKDLPLSFTNHHLKCGNSLVGARLDEIGNYPFSTAKKEPRQIKMFERDPDFRAAVEDALAKSRLIAARASTSLADVEEKKAWLAEIEEDLKGYKAICNVHTGLYFGNFIDEDEYVHIVEKREFASAFDLEKPNHYFHWNLEFPEVFLDKDGFDCIVGNPPYVRQEKLKELKSFLETFSIYTGGADLFSYFYEKSLTIAKPKGLVAFISSNSYLHTSSGKGLRRLLSSQSRISSIIDFGNIRVFESADTYVAIVVYSNEYPLGNQKIRVNKVEEAEGDTLEEKIDQQTLSFPQIALGIDAWNLVDVRQQALLQKIIQRGKPLKSIYGEPLSGIKTGANDILILNLERKQKIAETSLQNELVIPFRGGEDIRPWHINRIDQWLIGIPFGWTKKNFPTANSEADAWKELSRHYPDIANYLSIYKAELSNRSDQGEYWWELRPCQYWEDLKRPKIVWPQFGKVPRWSMDEEGLYLKNSSYFLSTDDYFLLGILNSRIVWFYISQTCKPMGKRAGLWRYMLLAQYLEKLPIPNVSNELREKIQSVAKEISVLIKDRDNADDRITLRETIDARLMQLDKLVLNAFQLNSDDYDVICEACPYTVDHVLELF